ncbi:hypothetical protein SprV_0401505300 [Sparganum proliferum]
MSLHLPHRRGKFDTITSLYIPPMTSSDAARNELYDELRTLLATMSETDKLIVHRDINARVVTDYAAWGGVLGPHGIPGSNVIDLPLLRICAEHRLILANAFFCLPTRGKMTRIHPRSRCWQLLNYVLVQRREWQGVMLTKATLDVDGWTDNGLVISKMRINLRRRRRPQGQRLASLLVAAAAAADDDDDIASMDNHLCQLRDTVQSTALAVIGRARRQR